MSSVFTHEMRTQNERPKRGRTQNTERKNERKKARQKIAAKKKAPFVIM